MNRANAGKLTPSQEDYLEAIWRLVWKEGIVRVRDIADSLGVSMPSVIGALKTLAKRKLVEYHPHKYVTLSDRGMELAESISARHGMLRKFLTDVLDVEAELADTNACRLEHAVDEVVSRRLGYFVKFMSRSSNAKHWTEEFRVFCARQEAAEARRLNPAGAGKSSNRDKKEERTVVTLADIKPGQKGRILRMGGSAGTKRRLASVGIKSDSVVSVVRIAPLGDLIEVETAGRGLSLRREQAQGIVVERFT